MIAVVVRFDVRDEVKTQLADTEATRAHLQKVVDGCRKVRGLKEKIFIMDPDTYAQGAMLLWEKREDFDEYQKSSLYKETVLDICKGEPRLEVYALTANLTDGVFI